MDINKTLEYLKSDDAKKSFKKYMDKLKMEEERLNQRIDRFHLKYGGVVDDVMKHILNKYRSNKYNDKEYKLGYEPRVSLLWFIFDYAKKYGEECNNEKYWNTFTGEAYYIGSYVIQVMIGQGSCILVEECEERKRLNKLKMLNE